LFFVFVFVFVFSVSYETAFKENDGKLTTGNGDILAWISELIWRDFHRHVLFFAPHISEGLPYHPETRNLPWRFDEKEFTLWCEGKTGFEILPLIVLNVGHLGDCFNSGI
jgi:deoxyribodipyrimidine photo-lyase